MRKLTLLFVLLMASCAAAQNQFYVNVNTGLDTNPGTQALPWKTLQHANAALTLGTNGTVVHVAAGTFNATRNQAEFSCIDTTTNGTANQRIQYISDVTYGAKIVCSSGGTSGGQIWMSSGSFTDIVGFDMSAPGSNICFGLNLNDTNERAISNKIHDIAAPIGFCGNGAGGAGIASGFANNQILRNLIDSVGFGNGVCNFIHGIYPGGNSTGTIVQNNIVSRACGWGIQFFHATTNEVVANNTVINNLRGGILLDHDSTGVLNNSTVINNISYGNGSDASQKDGIYLVSIGTANLISHNVLGLNKQFNIFSQNGTTPTYSGNICDISGTGCATVNAGVTAANLFVNYTGNAITGDYHPKSGSAAIVAGATSCQAGGISPCVPSADFDGTTQTSPPSIGAYTFTSSSVQPPTGLTTTVN